MTVPTLTWRDCPSGRKVAMLGEHEVGAVIPPVGNERTWTWLFWLNRQTVDWTPPHGGKTEHAAKDGVINAFVAWWKKAGLEPST